MKIKCASFLSGILIVMIVFSGSYLAISNSLSSKTIEKNIRTNLLEGFIYDENGNKTAIFQRIVDLTGLDEETVIKLMENTTVDEILTDIVNSIYDYNLTGDESYKYTAEQIISIVEDNIDKVLSEIDYDITIAERNEAINYTKTHTTYIIDSIYSTDIGDYKRQ